MKCGIVLKELRILKGATQQFIADRLYVERSTYAKWETGKIILRVDQLRNLAEIYGLGFEYISRCIEAERIVSKNDAERFIRVQEEIERRQPQI